MFECLPVPVDYSGTDLSCGAKMDRLCATECRGMSMRKRLQRSSGAAVTPSDLARTYRRKSRDAASASDIAAIDAGEGRTVSCSYRGCLAAIRGFAGCVLDLTRDGAVIRPLLILKRWQRIPVPAQVTGAWVRPFADQRGAFRLGGAGQYAPGGTLEQSGSVVICCQTADGLFEFAVRRPDVPLVLHFFDRLAGQTVRPASTKDAEATQRGATVTG